LNSFRAEKSGTSGVGAAIDAIASVPGISAVELNFPQHFPTGAESTVLDHVARAGLEVTAINLRFDGPLFADGAVGTDGEKIFHELAFFAGVVDTVSAGEAYLGVFPAGLIEGGLLSEALRRAAAVGALAVRERGAFGALPRRTERRPDSQRLSMNATSRMAY
jgi:sugar/nucleoside kinase (ribokinase family)